MSEKAVVGGIPVECLTGESAAIWSGWRTLGDREVVREASAKGTHIHLAYKYLSFKRNSSVDEAQDYFNKEVQIWINELLHKRQIYRASHILKNVGKDPKTYIQQTCIKCKEPSLRDYLSEYMINVNGFEPEHIKAWRVIKSMVQYEKLNNCQDQLATVLSIEDILNISEPIIQALCTELYFHTNEHDLLNNSSSTVLWNYFLSNNSIDMLRYWIDLQYALDVTKVECHGISEYLRSLFTNFNITADMVNSIESANASSFVKNLLKNYLCRHGIFTDDEKKDIKSTLRRIFSSGITLKEFDVILSDYPCNLDKNKFLQSVFEKWCLIYYDIPDESQESGKDIIALYEVLCDMSNPSEQDFDALIHAIHRTTSFISNDRDEFLKRNYLVLFTLIFVQYYKMNDKVKSPENLSDLQNEGLKEIFTDTAGLRINDDIIPHAVIQESLKQIPFLYQIIENQDVDNNTTMYDLLDSYKNINVKQLFKWRLRNETMPHFSNDNLVKKYGYKEALTYGYYLKEARPNMAIQRLTRMRGKLHSISSQRKSKVVHHAHIFALRHLKELEILLGCISFIDLLGADSEVLRLHITAANYIQKHLNISIGKLLEGIMAKSQDDLKTVMLCLENSFSAMLRNDISITDTSKFLEALKLWDIIVRFARVHNYALPNFLLKFLAKENLWFEFVLVGHIFTYSTEQILENMNHFEDANIREHLLTCLNNPHLTKSHLTVGEEQKLKSRDIRQSLYYKIGLKRNVSPSFTSSISSTDTSGSDSYVTISDHTSVNQDECLPADDLWLTILKCHKSQDPPGALLSASRVTRRPIFTILATCYEPTSTAAYCYSWMVISTANEDILSHYIEYLEQQVWPANTVLELIETMISCGYINILHRAYKIFMPESLFGPFFDFLLQCVTCGEFEECHQFLKNFKSHCASLKCNKIIHWESTDTTYSQNLYWVATVVIKCIITVLGKRLSSIQLQIKFLNVLIRSNFQADLPVDVPNFQCLIDFIKVLLKTNTVFNFAAFTVKDNVYSFDTEVRRCINELVADENYSSALELSNIAGFNSSEIVLAQWRNEFKRLTTKDDEVTSAFWRQCSLDFKNHSVCPQKATEFFVEHAEKVQSHKERYEILKLAFEALKNIEMEQETIDTLEMAMWKSYILAGPENIELEDNDQIFTSLKTELLSGLNKLKASCTLTDEFENDATETLINKLIDNGKLDIALRIAAMFNYKHKDLQILMLCLSLAEGEILPTQLTAQQRSFLAETSKGKQQKYVGTLRNRGLQRLSSSSSLNSSSLSVCTVGETSVLCDAESITHHQLQIECLSLLEKLLETLKHGTHIAKRIVLCYKLAVRLGKTYQSLLILSDPIPFLQEVVESNIDNKLEVANDIILAYKINNDRIVEFIVQSLTASITSAIEDGCEDAIAMWGYPLEGSFHLIMELCHDVSLLGLKLFETVHSLLGHSYGEKRNISILRTTVELLIRSHDCFTMCCNMEGIASVLRKCQNLANTLQNLKHWTLLVRLVTGVGRFTEMNYVFQILKDNDHFEFLLGKGLDKIPGLKMALLEFLKRSCPDEKELFTLVALHFRLYHEIALMWENEAKEIIKGLVSDAVKESKPQGSPKSDVKLTKTEYIQKLLHVAVTNYTHATQYYLQDKKLNLAGRCSHQAELVALQISLLGTVSHNQQVVCVFNLKTDEIDKVLCQHLNVPQALILIHAYDYYPDWTNLIYNHWIVNGEAKYLKEFIAIGKLTPALVEDCVRRYRLEKSITHSMTEHMITLISELTDIECKYMLASQLGFKSVVENMLTNPIVGAYLKDTIWKKGYSAS